MNKLITSTIAGLIGVGVMQAILPKTQEWLRDTALKKPKRESSTLIIAPLYAMAYGLNCLASTKLGNLAVAIPTFAFCATTCLLVQAGIITMALNTTKHLAICGAITCAVKKYTNCNLGLSAAVGVAGAYAIHSLIG